MRVCVCVCVRERGRKLCPSCLSQIILSSWPLGGERGPCLETQALVFVSGARRGSLARGLHCDDHGRSACPAAASLSSDPHHRLNMNMPWIGRQLVGQANTPKAHTPSNTLTHTHHNNKMSLACKQKHWSWVPSLWVNLAPIAIQVYLLDLMFPDKRDSSEAVCTCVRGCVCERYWLLSDMAL